MRGAAHEDRAWARERLYPRRDVHGVTHGRVLAGRVRADDAHDDRPGVDADPDLEIDRLLRVQLQAELINGTRHVEAATHRTKRIVLVRHGRAEEREQAVAHEPRDGTVVSRHGRVHSRERLTHDRGPVLGVHALGDGGRTGDIGEQHGEGTALARPGRTTRGDRLRRAQSLDIS